MKVCSALAKATRLIGFLVLTAPVGCGDVSGYGASGDHTPQILECGRRGGEYNSKTNTCTTHYDASADARRLVCADDCDCTNGKLGYGPDYRCLPIRDGSRKDCTFVRDPEPRKFCAGDPVRSSDGGDLSAGDAGGRSDGGDASPGDGG